MHSTAPHQQYQYKIRQKIHQVYQVPHVPDTLSTQEHATACSQYAQQCTPWQYQYKIRQQVIRSLRLRKILSVWVSTHGGIASRHTKNCLLILFWDEL